jgi:aquaporin Z
MRRYAVEAIGSFFLVFVITTTALLHVAAAPFAIAAVLAVMVFAGGHVSGAHYNPAVSVALAVRNRFAWRDLPAYATAQVCGAVAGALIGRYVVARHAAGPAFSASGSALAAAVAAEFLLTFALAYVVLNVATSRHTAGNSFYGLAIGGTVLVGALTVGAVSGGVFNPAVSVGVSAAGLISWSLLPVYLVAQVGAGALAGAVFRALNTDDIAEPADEIETALPTVAIDPAVMAEQLSKVASSVEALTTAFQGLPAGAQDPARVASPTSATTR